MRCAAKDEGRAPAAHGRDRRLLLGGGTATALPAEDRVVPAPPDAGDLLAGFASGLAVVRVHEAREKELRGAMVRTGRRDPVIARQLRAEVAAERTLLVAASAGWRR
jgi:hypothetical protein